MAVFNRNCNRCIHRKTEVIEKSNIDKVVVVTCKLQPGHEKENNNNCEEFMSEEMRIATTLHGLIPNRNFISELNRLKDNENFKFVLYSKKTGKQIKIQLIPKTNTAYNYRYYFLSLYSEKDWTYAGTLYHKENFTYRKGDKGAFDISHPDIKALVQILNTLDSGFNYSDLEIYKMIKCIGCGRLLTDIESIRRGFGVECWKFFKSKNGVMEV